MHGDWDPSQVYSLDHLRSSGGLSSVLGWLEVRTVTGGRWTVTRAVWVVVGCPLETFCLDLPVLCSLIGSLLQWCKFDFLFPQTIDCQCAYKQVSILVTLKAFCKISKIQFLFFFFSDLQYWSVKTGWASSSSGATVSRPKVLVDNQGDTGAALPVSLQQSDFYPNRQAAEVGEESSLQRQLLLFLQHCVCSLAFPPLTFPLVTWFPRGDV